MSAPTAVTLGVLGAPEAAAAVAIRLAAQGRQVTLRLADQALLEALADGELPGGSGEEVLALRLALRAERLDLEPIRAALWTEVWIMGADESPDAWLATLMPAPQTAVAVVPLPVASPARQAACSLV